MYPATNYTGMTFNEDNLIALAYRLNTMHNRRNYYRILHVQPDAPSEIIRSCYRTLMQTLKHHPDLGGDEWNASLINEAYDTLMDPQRRADYNRDLAERKRLPEFNRNKNNSERKPQNQQPSAQTGNLCPFCETPWSADPAVNPDAICSKCQSPLYPAVRIQDQGSCQRAVQRIELHKPLNIFLKNAGEPPLPGILRNLSPNGLQFTCTAHIEVGQIAKIEAHAFSAIAQIVNIADGNTLGKPVLVIGARFLTLRFHTLRGTFVSAKA